MKDLVVSSAPVKEAFLELMKTAHLPEPLRKMAIYIFGDNMDDKEAIKKAFGMELPAEDVMTAFYNDPAAKRVIDMIRSWYVSIAPMAAMRETEMLLSDEWDYLKATEKAKLIESVHQKAGVIEVDPTGNKVVPVQVNIIVPQAPAQPAPAPQVVLNGEEVTPNGQ